MTRRLEKHPFAYATLALALATAVPSGYAGAEEDAVLPAPRPIERDLPAQRGKAPPAARNSKDDPTSPDTEGALTLEQALDLALRFNPELAAAEQGVRAAEGSVRQAGVRPNPEIEIEAEDFGGSGETAAQQTTIRLSQAIELGGKRGKRRALARSEADLAGWDYAAKRLEVLTQTRKAFVDVLHFQGRIALAETMLALAEDVRKAAAERVKAGKVPLLEETKAGVEVAAARIALDRAKRELDTARKRLAAVYGGTMPVFKEAVGNLDAIWDVPPLEKISALPDDTPEVARWNDAVALSRKALALARAERIPDIALNAGARRHEDDGIGSGVFGFSLPLPVFNLNAGGILAAKHLATRAEYEQRAARLRATTDLVEAHNRLETARAEAQTIKAELLPGAQQAFDAAQTGYREGKYGHLEALDAQRTLNEARTRHIEALADYHKAAADVERLTGTSLNTIR